MMTQRNVASVQAQRADIDAYVQSASSEVVDEITKLGELQANGVLTADEFDRQKAKLLA